MSSAAASSAALQRIVALIRSETGIEVKENQLSALTAALARITPGMDAERFLSESAAAPGGGGLIGRLIDQVTVQETYFFRSPNELEAIDWRQLAERTRAEGREEVRVWVAACATGEEVYTLAILACEAFRPAPAPVSILGTDISTAALEGARRGLFSERSQRNVPAELKERYVHRAGGGFAIREALRPLVRFRRHNLARDAFPPTGEVPFDVIACRNVLIYLDPPAIKRTLRGLESALRPGGPLILGAADRLAGSSRGPTPERPPTAPRPRPRAQGRRPPARDHPREGDRPPRPRRRPGRSESRVAETRAPATTAGPLATVQAALQAADAGDLSLAIEICDGALDDDPLNAELYFVRGLAELGSDAPKEAAISFRRALYTEPSFALAAFELGRALDARGDDHGARRAYAQALRSFDPDDVRHEAILEKVDVGDLAAACSERLRLPEATA